MGKSYNILSDVLMALHRWHDGAVHFRRIKLPEIAFPIIGFCLRIRYFLRRMEVRKASKKRKLKVIFVLGDITKWKGKLVYRRMMEGDRFDPYVAPAVLDRGFYTNEELRPRLVACIDYFRKQGYRVLPLNDVDTLEPIAMSEVKPDIVVYMQEWGYAEVHSPIVASEIALTYYLPYANYSYGDIYEQFEIPLARFQYCCFMDHDGWVNFYRRRSRIWRFGCRMVGAGGPRWEEIRDACALGGGGGKCVIFAPHWSFKHPKNISAYYKSTFDWSGKPILEFAKAHPEVRWIFKPHPGLRSKLESTGLMTREEVAEYYAAWEKIGESNYDSNYEGIFARSTAMITDCETFLIEYLIANKPLIRLATSDQVPLPPNARLLDAFYEAWNLDEMNELLQKVVLKGEDPMAAARAQVRHEFGLDDIHSVDRVMAEFGRMLVMRNEQ